MSWPSTSATCQPATRKRSATSSLIDSAVLPSSVIWLSSQSSTSRPQPQVARQRNHLLPDAFLQAAIADEGIGEMIDQPGAEAGALRGFGDGHAEGVGDALPERPGGDLDALARVEFRVAFAVRAQFPETPDLVERNLLVAGQVVQRPQQHRAVAVREHDTVAVGPGGVGGVELQVPGVEGGGDFRHAQRHPLVALGGPHDGVDGQEADGVGEGGRGRSGHVVQTFGSGQRSQVLMRVPSTSRLMP